MFQMAADTDSPLLTPDERPVARLLNADGRGRAVLVCEHASRFIPASLDNLGLNAEALVSHAAWDIGARDLVRGMSGALDAPLVEARVSRLVYDCNRPPEAPDATPAQSERFAIPGNADLTGKARATRIAEVYEPFSALLADTLDRHEAPVMITLHSFTPVYSGRQRRVEIGVLHDTDARLADAMLATAARHTSLIVGRNDPYGPEDGVTHTLRRHGITRGIPNVMIEVRNDLLGDAAACGAMAEMLGEWLGEAMKMMDSRKDNDQ